MEIDRLSSIALRAARDAEDDEIIRVSIDRELRRRDQAYQPTVPAQVECDCAAKCSPDCANDPAPQPTGKQQIIRVLVEEFDTQTFGRSQLRDMAERRGLKLLCAEGLDERDMPTTYTGRAYFVLA